MSDIVEAAERALNSELQRERAARLEAERKLDEVRALLLNYNRSTVKAWGRTLQRIGDAVDVEVES